MVIEIWTRDGLAENENRALAERLSRAGLPVKTVRLSRLYSVDAPWSAREFGTLAKELLADRITEKYSLSNRPGMKNMYRVEVWLKSSATDVIGESVKEAVHDMIGRSPGGVRFGRAYYVACASEAKLRAVTARTLANEVVNSFTVKKI